MAEVALIVGAGAGLSGSLARLLAAEGVAVALAARGERIRGGVPDGARAYRCDASEPDQVEALFAAVAADLGAPDLVVYNPSWRVRAPLVDLAAADVRRTLEITAFGGFLVVQQAARAMLPRGSGTILLTGASASVKGYPGSAPFAMGKFALRGLAQSAARELAPRGIHVGHVVIDGAIRPPGETDPADRPASRLDPDAIARTYLMLHRQDRSAWSWEIELRPWVERF